MPNITTKTARLKLARRREPYWLKLGPGRGLGFRAGPATWIARLRSADGKHSYKALNDLGTDADYNVAKAAAERWFALTSGSARKTVKRGTVRSALASYLRYLRSDGRRDTARTAARTFRLVIDDTFGRMRLESVTRDDVEGWRGRNKGGREPRSLNRYVRDVVAALNYAVEERDHVGDKKAWSLTHLTDDNEHESAIFLSRVQRDRLIAAAPKPLAALLKGYGHTGSRPSELANATVSDFDPKGGTVSVRHHKGKGARLKVRAIALSSDGIAFFKAQARGKAADAPLIAREDGTHWHSVAWSRGIREAAVAANNKAKKPAQIIPDGVSAYSFRHTRISELLQLFNVDPLTVAVQCGTSVAQIEKHYYKFIASSMRAKLDAVKKAAK